MRWCFAHGSCCKLPSRPAVNRKSPLRAGKKRPGRVAQKARVEDSRSSVDSFEMPLALTPSLRVARIILPLAAVMSVHAPSASAAPGSLALQGCASTSAVDSCALGFGLTGAHGVAASSDGASVYVASKTNGAIASFERDPATGATSEIGCFSQGVTGGCTTDSSGALLGAA